MYVHHHHTYLYSPQIVPTSSFSRQLVDLYNAFVFFNKDQYTCSLYITLGPALQEVTVHVSKPLVLSMSKR